MTLLPGLINSTLLYALCLVVVALGGMFTERSGTINIGLEGTMIVGATFGALTIRAFNMNGFGEVAGQWAVLIAVLVAALSGCIYSMLLAFASIHMKADQTIGGTALNIFAPAFCYLLVSSIQSEFSSAGSTTVLFNYDWVTFNLGFSEEFRNSFFGILLFKGFAITTPIAILIWIISTIVLYKTRFGLRLMSCGEHPQAAASAGIGVYTTRYIGVGLSGLLAGFGGIMWAFIATSGVAPGAGVAGFGFLALAVMIFGNWKPQNILGAALIFAFFNALGKYSSGIDFLPSFSNLAQGTGDSIYKMLPYIVTLVVLAFTSKKSRAPKMEGIPYDKGAR
ncbi:MAG: ABC transporter permease [Bacillales bacterium]|nr:ABC transporter permease [Bacillales bacterium]